MSYAIQKDGKGWRAINSHSDCTGNEIYSDTQPLPSIPTNEEIRASLAPLSAWQIRKVLNQSGLRKQVEDAVLVADSDTQDAWHYASEFRRDDAILNAMAVTLGITATQLDGLFELGVTL